MSHQDKLRTRAATDAYRENLERIFGKDKKVKKGRYVQVDGKLIPAEQYTPKENSSPYVMSDIEPYRSVLDGSIISSRSQHRAHKRQHGVVEVGNEKLRRGFRKEVNPKGIKEDLVKTMREKGMRIY